MKFIIIQVKDDKYAINIEDIHSIDDYKEITKIPLQKDYVLGIVSYRDSVVKIIDIEKILYGNNTQNKNKIVYLNVENATGIVVNDIKNIMNVEQSQIEEDITDSKLVKGLIREGSIIPILDIGSIDR